MADDYPTHIFGVDFSGAADAGKYIWITEGNRENGCLLITDCRSASDFLNIHPKRDLTIPALAEFIESRRHAAFGFDFPFGLPKSMVGERTWFRFATSFATRFPSIEDFDIECHSASGGKEWKRLSDIETKAPFSPYNRRVMYQTYYGIRDLLQPLVLLGKISVPPIHQAALNLPCLLEVCPAGALKTLGLYKPPYKGRTRAHYDARSHILKTLENSRSITVPSLTLRDTILSNTLGDALDSVLAAVITAKAITNPAYMDAKSGDPYCVEGCIYI